MKKNKLPAGKMLKTNSGTEQAIHAFHTHVINLPWYHSMVEDLGLDPNSVKTAADFFSRVPILNKMKVFGSFDMKMLMGSKNWSGFGSLMLSSGHSGHYSFGLASKADELAMADETDLFLSHFFSVQPGEALVINASGMGVRAYTNHVSCDTGLRSDLVVGLLKQIAPDFKKLVISSGDPHFLKKLIEESLEAGIDWSKFLVYFITGGDWFPESLRNYVHNLTGKSAFNPDQGYWSAIYGLTELGYPLLFEVPKLAQIRSNLSKNRKELKNRLSYIEGNFTTPFFFHHLPASFYAETVTFDDQQPHLLITTQNFEKAIPFVRYDTGDLGETNVCLPEEGLFPLPVTAFWGRSGNAVETGGCRIMVNDIRELLFDDHQLAARCTGYFSLEKSGRRIQLQVQLKKGFCMTHEIAERFEHALQLFYPDRFETSFVAYHECRQQMELDFERKFNHLI